MRPQIETFSPAEAAQVLKCHVSTVYDLIKTGRLVAATKIGRTKIITRKALDDLIREGQNLHLQEVRAERSRKVCQSASEVMESGIATLPTRTGSELDALCKQTISGRRRNSTTR